MTKNTFGKWLQTHRKEARLSMQALADSVGLSKQYISVLERGQPHALTGKPVTPKKESVDALAVALNRSINEARHAAGYASEGVSIPLEIEAVGFEGLDKTDIQNIVTFIEFIKYKKGNRTKETKKELAPIKKGQTRKLTRVLSEKVEGEFSSFTFADEEEFIAAGGNYGLEEDE